MNVLSTLYHIMRADFQERVRRYSFLITLGITIYCAYLLVPAPDAGYVTMKIDNYRGVYNSAWIGMAVALLATFFLAFAGFYLVKNAIERDRTTGVGQIIAATPVSRVLYMLGKFVSNFAFLSVMVGVVAAAALAMQFLRGEDYNVRPWNLLSPFILITLPAMALTAAIAVLFESISWLKGGAGNVLYFILSLTLISAPMLILLNNDGGNFMLMFMDVYGMGFPVQSIRTAAMTAVPGIDISQFSLGLHIRSEDTFTFLWEGIEWTAEIIAVRLFWVIAALCIMLLAAVLFDRFDIVRTASRKAAAKSSPGEAEETAQEKTTWLGTRINAIEKVSSRYSFTGMLFAELRLMLKGVKWWWYLTALGLVIACAAAPKEVSMSTLYPVALAWPILLWSSMGAREVRFNVNQLVFSGPCSLYRQYPAVWLAGVAVGVLCGSGMGLRLALTGDGPGLTAWAAGILFIPALALFFGTVSKSSKLFEVVYLVAWYMGPMSKFPYLDFTGASQEARAMGMPGFTLAAALLLLVLAFFARRRQIRV